MRRGCSSDGRTARRSGPVSTWKDGLATEGAALSRRFEDPIHLFYAHDSMTALDPTGSLETDYLVVGAGAMGMAFTDALIDHADVHVILVDRRHAPAGTGWTRIHSSSSIRHRCSTAWRRPCSGPGASSRAGPESGLHERARQPEIQAYYDDVLHRRLLGSGSRHLPRGVRAPRGGFLPSGHLPAYRARPSRSRCDGGSSTPPISSPTDPGDHPAAVRGRRRRPRDRRSTSSCGRCGMPTELRDRRVRQDGHRRHRVVVANGVRRTASSGSARVNPWMLNRAVVQPDPAVALGLAADTMAAAAAAESLDDVFLRLEAADAMLRIDRGRHAHHGQDPHLGTWELELLRTVEQRRSTRAPPARDPAAGSSSTTGRSLCPRLARGALCRLWTCIPADGPRLGPGQDPASDHPGRLPVLQRRAAGYVEATRDDDRERNRLCPPEHAPATASPAGPGCRFVEPSRLATTALSRTSPRGPTAAH